MHAQLDLSYLVLMSICSGYSYLFLGVFQYMWMFVELTTTLNTPDLCCSNSHFLKFLCFVKIK